MDERASKTPGNMVAEMRMLTRLTRKRERCGRNGRMVETRKDI